LRLLEQVEDGLSPGAAESLAGIVALAHWLRRAVIVAFLVSVTVLSALVAGHDF
jgi:hypothetical protein